ncbi:hypothetical protein [Leptospira sanjuanensis]|uniref:hypothetical protein n=1 Tax=Leptospira sanjuanensis TaxID=2879643 RepID=UPI001EE96D60|nr:hypothetical protein [Leptospira sanjuanensis]MCG6170258.1 hypothetical protein [Leptospira sanjuanensis]
MRREEYAIFLHNNIDKSNRMWVSTGQKYIGGGAKEKAIEEAKRLQKTAPEGIEYSVQHYVYSEKSKGRPVKTKIWRNGTVFYKAA